jgi:hypothetical protein
MQYLLTEDEFKDRVHKDEVLKRDNALAAAREKLLLLAGFDCIHDKAGRNAGGYCSECPCSPIHGGNDYATWARVCWLVKSYPQ